MEKETGTLQKIRVFAKKNPLTVIFSGALAFASIPIASSLLQEDENPNAQCEVSDWNELENILWQGGEDAQREQVIENAGIYIATHSENISQDEVGVALATLAYWDAGNNGDADFSELSSSYDAHPIVRYSKFIYNMRIDDYDTAQNVLTDAIDDNALGCADNWDTNKRRYLLAHRAKRNGDMSTAYKIAQNHNAEDAYTKVEMEFLAGEIKLREGEPDMAAEHFKEARSASTTPISVSRMEYYIGRAYTAMEETEKATRHYELAAEHPSAFYGQVASATLGKSLRFAHAIGSSDNQANIREELRKYSSYEGIETALRAKDYGNVIAGFDGLIAEMVAGKYLDDPDTKDTLEAQIAWLSRQIMRDDRQDVALVIAKKASEQGLTIDSLLYPEAEEFKDILQQEARKYGADVAHSYAIARRESMFYPYAQSPVGAKGLMQIMPYTAEIEADINDIKYSEDKLTNTRYNAGLGTSYLQSLTDDYGGSVLMATAAYNTGPSNLKNWVRDDMGDPRKLDSLEEFVDWIESIPYEETRNYVMRVTEGMVAYKNMYQGQNIGIDQVLRSGQILPGTELDPLPFEIAENPPLAYAASFDACPNKMLFSHRGNDLAVPASLTKVMTLYIAAKAMTNEDTNFDLETRVRVPQIAMRKSRGLASFDLEAGDRFPLHMFMTGTGAKSDAISVITVALATADALGWKGSESEKYYRFVGEMRDVAEELGMNNTYFMNVTGDNGNYGTPEDFIKLMNAFEKDAPRTFHVALGQTKFRLPGMTGGTTPSSRFQRRNPNDVLGAKTGYLKAGDFNVAFKSKAGVGRLTGVVFGADSPNERAYVADAMTRAARNINVRDFCNSRETKMLLRINP
ncbi:MAG: hypothetical protein CL565_06910 [Alphaproteobacteria bacterium]|nr:hypothetical protein [Alphaproteobacteria bacterium]